MADIGQIIKRLKEHYPAAKISLDYQTPLELVVAVILSAQCTDKRVNLITPALFAKYKTCRDYIEAPKEELERLIFSAGFYRAKAKNIKGMATILESKFGGKLPSTIEEMLELPGVARKTANVVLGELYGTSEGFTVDTHVIRLSRRLGLAKKKTPKDIEIDLIRIVPKDERISLAHRLIAHGRSLCPARSPKCRECFLRDICPSAKGD
ncbi:MAG: endonuclease III [Parcubacteria group bacterium Gr01-1014_18]|nr:MAG: endonuclease III [Parcubacteria group bacterium Greene0416_36]TSC79756.1 MAG: endonuclease III [Parcubacteria group bacterium Gr01-1014_18]TSC97908.1 MAG: endonuclease III [Parcubacteria group bacterium Greene1014_20]TSD06566.1 MAG: endonuclease III [Parcubacteria group bacterium Greene0714_2]